jgi:hypothetical protein
MIFCFLGVRGERWKVRSEGWGKSNFTIFRYWRNGQMAVPLQPRKRKSENEK